MAIEFIIPFDFKLTAYISTRKCTWLCNLSQSSNGYACLVHKHINLIDKFSHLVWFGCSIFYASNLRFTLLREIPIAYSKRIIHCLYSKIWIIQRVTDNGKFYRRQILLITSSKFHSRTIKSRRASFSSINCSKWKFIIILWLKYLLSGSISQMKVKWRSDPLLFLSFWLFSSVTFEYCKVSLSISLSVLMQIRLL